MTLESACVGFVCVTLLIIVFSTDSPLQKPGGVMTIHDYGYLPPGFLKSYPVSE